MIRTPGGGGGCVCGIYHVKNNIKKNKIMLKKNNQQWFEDQCGKY